MKILLVEDDELLASALSQGLAEEGHHVDLCTSGAEAIAQGVALDYDLAILDWQLPDVDGLTVLRTWRKRDLRMRVLMLTARGTLDDRVTGLRSGADDYMVKPFEFEELLARLEVLRRRTAEVPVPPPSEIDFDVRRRTLVCHGKEVALTAREYALALALFESKDQVCSRSHLLAAVWGADYEGDAHIVDVYVGYVRRKLADAGADSIAIRTVRGLGFCLESAGSLEALP